LLDINKLPDGATNGSETRLVAAVVYATVAPIGSMSPAIIMSLIASIPLEIFCHKPVCTLTNTNWSSPPYPTTSGEDVSIKLYQYLERGVSNGSHSIPSIGLPPVDGAHRILHIHNNVPGVLSAINTVMSKNKINIVGQYLKTNDEIGYVVLDVDSKLSKTAFDLLKEVKHTIRARMLY
jgi:hypothetical protein